MACVVVRREEAGRVLEIARAREAGEAYRRRQLANGELSLDLYDMRYSLFERGLRYEEAEPEERG